MKNTNQIQTLRGAYEAPRCEIVNVHAERGLCLSSNYGAGHYSFGEDDLSDKW